MYLWLHIQSIVDVVSVLVWCLWLHIQSIVDVVSVLAWHLWLHIQSLVGVLHVVACRTNIINKGLYMQPQVHNACMRYNIKQILLHH